MPCSKPSPFHCFLINWGIVLIVFAVVDFVIYGVIFPGVNPYLQDWQPKLLLTFLLSAAYAHIYNMASKSWAPYSKLRIFIPKKELEIAKDCNWSWNKNFNGMAFSAIVSIAILICIWFSGLFISFIYLYLLHGGHGGDVSTETASDIAAKLILAGVVLEWKGRTEDDPRM